MTMLPLTMLSLSIRRFTGGCQLYSDFGLLLLEAVEADVPESDFDELESDFVLSDCLPSAAAAFL